MCVKTFHILDTALYPPFPKELSMQMALQSSNVNEYFKIYTLSCGLFPQSLKALSLFGSGYLHLGSLQAFTIQYVQRKWPSF